MCLFCFAHFDLLSYALMNTLFHEKNVFTEGQLYNSLIEFNSFLFYLYVTNFCQHCHMMLYFLKMRGT